MVKLTYLGHACFKVECSTGCFVIDPYKDVPGFPDISLTCDQVFCSHSHYDHNYTQQIRQTKRSIDMAATTVSSWHDDQGGELRGENLIHIFDIEGVRLVHLGDLGHQLSPQQINQIGHVDVLMVPIGGTYTLTTKEAKKVCDTLHPTVIVPMHYRAKSRGLQMLTTVDEFVDLFSGVPVHRAIPCLMAKPNMQPQIAVMVPHPAGTGDIVCIDAASADVTVLAHEPLKFGFKNPFSTISVAAGGVTRNAGEVLSRLGQPVSILSAVGEDCFASAITTLCEEAGMDTQHIKVVPNSGSCTCVSMLQPGGELGIMAADLSIAEQINISYLQQEQDVLLGAKDILISPFFAPDVIDYVLDCSAQSRVWVDVASAQFADTIRPRAGKFFGIKANEEEAFALTGIQPQTEQQALQAARAMIQMGCQLAAITLGARGCCLATRDKEVFMPATPCKPVSVAGAGDSFFGGLVYACRMGYSLEKAGKTAMAVSALTIASPYTVSPHIDPDEL